VLKPSSTSLLGGFGYLLISRTRAPFRTKLLIEHVLHRDLTRQDTWALNFNSVVEHANLNVRRDAVIGVQHCVGHNFMQRFRRIRHRFKTLGPSFLMPSTIDSVRSDLRVMFRT
jgi:hypothetical protein